MQETQVSSLSQGRSPGEGTGHPGAPVFLPGKSHGQREAWQAAVHGVAKESGTNKGLNNNKNNLCKHRTCGWDRDPQFWLESWPLRRPFSGTTEVFSLQLKEHVGKLP